MRTIALIVFTFSMLFSLSVMQGEEGKLPAKNREKVEAQVTREFQNSFWMAFVIQRGEPGPVFRRSMDKVLAKKIRELTDDELVILNKRMADLTEEETEVVRAFTARTTWNVLFTIVFMDANK
jgi:hypothetical protein